MADKQNTPDQTEQGTAAPVVYIRLADPESLPEEFQNVEETPWAIHDPTGARVGLARDRRQAFALARRHDLIPVSVH